MGNFCICPKCLEEVSYTLRRESIKIYFEGRDYYFMTSFAVCDKCGAKMLPHKLKGVKY